MSWKPLSRITRTAGFGLALWYSVFFILSTLVLFCVAYLLVSSSLREGDQESVYQELRELAALYENEGLEALKRELTLQESLRSERPFFIRFTSPYGDLRLLTSPDDWRAFDVRRPERTAHVSIPGQPNPTSPVQAERLEVVSTRLADGALLEVGQSTADRQELLRRFKAIFAGVMIPVVFVGFTGGAILAFRTLRPIRHLVNTIRAISSGTTSARVPIRHTDDELDELSRLFNRMLERNAALILGMRGALDNVAHELRTPIARIRGISEVALRAEPDRAGYRDALADCVEEADRLLTMVNTLMDISEAETGALRLRLEPVNLARVIEDVVDLYHDVADEKDITVAVTVPDELWVTADGGRLRQVVANLLDNAIKYTSRGGRVVIAASDGPEHVTVTVRDSGIGIEPPELPRIWDRLYRGDHGRSQRGLGLGLCLVKAVVEAHGGTVDVASTPGVGSGFTIRVPTAFARTG